jgi:hypothetical protein
MASTNARLNNTVVSLDLPKMPPAQTKLTKRKSSTHY